MSMEQRQSILEHIRPSVRGALLNLVDRISPIRDEQAVRYLVGLTGCQKQSALRAIKEARGNHEIWVDKSGLISRGKLVRFSEEDKDNIDAFQIVLPFIPESENFSLCNFPTNIMFVAKQKIIEVIVVPDGNETIMKIALKKGTDESMKKDMRRMAILRNPNNIDRLSECGITNFLTVNSNTGEVTILKKIPAEEAWL